MKLTADKIFINAKAYTCLLYTSHQFTERVETVYTYEVLPEILYKTMMHMLQN